VKNLFFPALGKLRSPAGSMLRAFVPYGRCKADGSHDHRTNCSGDRTPAQKAGDAKRSKPRKQEVK
jgi:hypothetical protein